jgi:sugar-specific transcriptional regulator TrmB
MSNLAGIISKKEPSLFALVPQKEAVVMKIKELSENAKYSIDVVNSRRRHLLSASVFRKEIYKALDRGVKFRVIAQKDKDEGLLPKAQVDIESHPGFKIKYVLTKPSAMVSIFDNREVLIVEDESVDQITAPTLWSNNKSLVTLAQNYFDMLWHAQTE